MDIIKIHFNKVLESFLSWNNLNVETHPFTIVQSDENFFVKQDGNSVIFNAAICLETPEDHFMTIIIHEAVHAWCQNVPNKSDVIHLRGRFGDNYLNRIDIQADLITATFLNERYGWDFEKWMKAYYYGNRVFLQDTIDQRKFDRFISMLISTYTYFDKNGKYLIDCKWHIEKQEDKYHIYSIKKLANLDVVIEGQSIRYDFLKLDIELQKLAMLLYHDCEAYSFKKYFSEINLLCQEIVYHIGRHLI